MTDQQQRYIARVSNKAGKAIYLSPAFETREEAARDAFIARPRAFDCSTARASFVGGNWCDFGFDIRGHRRYQIMGRI